MRKTANYTKLLLIVGCIVIFGGLLFSEQSFAGTAKELDASADAAMDRFYKMVKNGKEAAAKSKGMLILPNVKKGAFIVGAEYGQGTMRIGGKTVEYYSMGSGSLGLQFGGQSKDIIIAFNSSEALKKFRESKGWEVGVDGSVALIELGAAGTIDTSTIKDPIIGFVFGNKGLMADLSLAGSKYTKIVR